MMYVHREKLILNISNGLIRSLVADRENFQILSMVLLRRLQTKIGTLGTVPVVLLFEMSVMIESICN